MSTEGIPRWATHLDKLNSPRKVVSEVSYLIQWWTLQSFCNKDSMTDFSGWISGVKKCIVYLMQNKLWSGRFIQHVVCCAISLNIWGKLQIAFQIYTANSVETSLFDSLSVALFREFLFSLRKTFNYLLRTFSSTCSKLWWYERK